MSDTQPHANVDDSQTNDTQGDQIKAVTVKEYKIKGPEAEIKGKHAEIDELQVKDKEPEDKGQGEHAETGE